MFRELPKCEGGVVDGREKKHVPFSGLQRVGERGFIRGGTANLGITYKGVPSVLRRLNPGRNRICKSSSEKTNRKEIGGNFMKTVTARDLQKKVKECMDLSQEDQVVITRHGKPVAVLVGVEGRDWEDLVLQTSPAFWKLIEDRRKQRTISLTELNTRLRKHKK